MRGYPLGAFFDSVHGRIRVPEDPPELLLAPVDSMVSGVRDEELAGRPFSLWTVDLPAAVLPMFSGGPVVNPAGVVLALTTNSGQLEEGGVEVDRTRAVHVATIRRWLDAERIRYRRAGALDGLRQVFALLRRRS